MNLKTMRRNLLRRLGYVKSPSPYQFNTAFEAQKKLTNTQNPLIFDVGAYKGQMIAEYQSLFPDCTIFSFEPFPDSFEVIRNKYSNSPRVHLYQLGLLDVEGMISFYSNSNPATNSFLPLEGEKGEEKILVSSKTLDTFCEEGGIASIDILKMDAQGAEGRILKGAEKLLTEKRIKLIYTEVLFSPLYEEQAYFHDLSHYLHQLGYKLFDIYHPRYADNGQLCWADAIFSL